MNIEHFTISITEEQTGCPLSHGPAQVTAYLLDPIPHTGSGLRPCIVICPGGGYEHLSVREDQPPAMEYLSAGIQTFVLHYSVSPDLFPRALMELAETVRLIRRRSAEWQIDPQRIVVSGFSAGGHLAASLGVFWDKPWLSQPLGADPAELRPNGMLLCYPVITSGEYCHPGSFLRLIGSRPQQEDQLRALLSLEKQVGPHTPPAFLWHTWTDQTVPVENSLLLLSALRRHGISAEAHLYPAGCHGLSLASHETEGEEGRFYEPSCQGWIELAKRWIKELPAAADAT